MLKFEKIDQRDIYAALIVILVSAGIWHLAPKATLPEFGAAMQIQRIAGMGSVPSPHIALAALLEPPYASLFGMAAGSPQAIVSFLLVFPTILLAISASAIYLALRALAYGKKESAFAALLFALSLCTLEFLPGIYRASALGCALFAIFMAGLAFYVKRGSVAALLLAAVFAFLSAYVAPAFAVAGIVAVVFFAALSKRKGVAGLWQYGLLALAFIAAPAVLGNYSQLGYTLESLRAAFLTLPFLMAAASICAGLCFAGACGIEWLALFASGVLLCGITPLAGAALLAIPAAEGIRKAAGDIPKKARLAAAYFPFLFAAFAITSAFFSAYQSAVASALFAVLGPLLMHLYDYNNRAFFAAAGALLLALSFFTAAVYQAPPAREFYPDYLSTGMAASLSDLAAKQPSSVIALGRDDAARFYLPSAKIAPRTDAEGFLAKGRPEAESGTYIIMTPAEIDALSQNQSFGSYRFISEFAQSGGNGQVAFFSSSDGMLVAREIDASGNFALKDGAYVDNYGRQYATIPLSRIFMLAPNKSHSDATNRVIVIGEDALPPHILSIYSGGAASPVSEFGDVTVYKVN